MEIEDTRDYSYPESKGHYVICVCWSFPGGQKLVLTMAEVGQLELH